MDVLIADVAGDVALVLAVSAIFGASRNGRRHAPLLVAVIALLAPMVLGAGTVLVFRSSFAEIGQPHIDRSFILFMAVAISITALPVLAAIVRERGIAGTIAGTTAMSAAGLMDAAAWRPRRPL